MPSRIESRTRMVMRTLHWVSVCGWIGGGLAILILLKLAGSPNGHDEALAFQRSIKAIDDLLITPSAGLATLSGLLLCRGKPWGFWGHRWITEKCFVTTVLLVFGALWLAPGLQNFAPSRYWLSGYQDQYLRSWLWGAIAATLQTAVLLLVVALSVLKPEKNRQH
ncbi:hypothetical protein GMLC_00590 [Geomonas limicola]|uniref:DUF2269 domain-containing protein n=1 Tax=Geomonas limicola TaxID=2740186 RepID=A0A6V8N2B0_9BACT|nr:hypothetical protein [Geomonas limicola]GFO66480.1 hypothetical protein GMLC_00590 [Geomonas limicola]